jgi:hypothetical protein
VFENVRIQMGLQEKPSEPAEGTTPDLEQDAADE